MASYTKIHGPLISIEYADFQGLNELTIEDYNDPNDKFLLINPDMLSLGFRFGERVGLSTIHGLYPAEVKAILFGNYVEHLKVINIPNQFYDDLTDHECIEWQVNYGYQKFFIHLIKIS